MNVVSFICSLPHRLAHVDVALDQLVEVTARLRAIALDLVDASRRSPPAPVEPTYVYVLAPGHPMLAQRATIARGVTDQIWFDAIAPLPAGAWITVVGPAVIRGVKVGNQFQQAMSDPSGHVCTTVDALLVGQRLTVELFAP